MGIFDDVKLGWGGRDYTIPGNKVMGAIARVEEHVTLFELQQYTRDRGTLPMAKIAQAFAVLLTYAGAQGVQAEDIYASMFSAGEGQHDALTAVTVLMAMMVPPPSMVAGGPRETPGKPQPAAAKSSSRSTRRR